MARRSRSSGVGAGVRRCCGSAAWIGWRRLGVGRRPPRLQTETTRSRRGSGTAVTEASGVCGVAEVAALLGGGVAVKEFAGINGVLYYTPQILEQVGVGILLSDIGISSDSASFLISGLTTLLMLPAIGVAMRLMDLAGRRSLLLRTIPVLIVSLIVLVVSNLVKMGSVVHAVLSTVSVIVYFCCFVMAFGPVPNILCAEIFPTRVRGVCIAICSLTFWFGDIVVTYTLPVMLNTIGLAGVFGIYAVVCVFALVFVYLKVPETKGMPLELITEFFALGARQAANNEGTERSTVWLLEEQDADETEES